MMNNQQIIEKLNAIDGFSNASSVAYFECTRRMRDGGYQQVIIEIHDHGDNAHPDTRYGVYAHDARDPKICATGNEQSDIPSALAVVHWGDLG